jgi:DNA-directed RNA polymerase specialized sigma24 family protein
MRPDDDRECAEHLRASLPRLHRTAYLLCGNATEADDIVQATPAESTVEDRDELTTALARLPAGQRAVLVLRYYADLSIEDTAATLGCSAGNVKSQASRGLAAMRELIGRDAAEAACRPC